MKHGRSFRRTVLLALSLLSACAAAADPSGASTESRLLRRHGAPRADGATGAFLIGHFANLEGDTERAADELLRALALDPDSAELRLQAFNAALLAGRPEAVTLARQELDNPAAQLLLGGNDAAAGNWEQAERRFAGLPRSGLTDVLKPLLQAWSQYGSGHADVALATLRPFVEGQRFRAIYAFHAAMIADLATRAGEATRLYRTAENEFGTMNLDLARTMGSFMMRQGHEAEARQMLTNLGQTAPDLAIALPRLQADLTTRPVRRATDGIAEAYLALAVALRQQDAGEFADILLRLALNLRPDMTAARLLLADVAEQAKHADRAVAVLAPVGESDPLAAVVDLRRAQLYQKLGNSDEAMRIAQAVATAYPDRPEPWALQGGILRGRHDYAGAVAAYDKAVARTPGPLTRANWPLFYERGISLERAHDWPRAQADFEHALQLSPDEPFVLNYLAYSWTERGQQLPRAQKMLEKAAEARPNDGAILDSLGWVMLRQQDTAAAVKWLEKATELEPEDSTINGHLGDAYWAAGRKLEAQYQWRLALALNPDPEDVPKLQAKLKDANEAVGMITPPATANRATP